MSDEPLSVRFVKYWQDGLTASRGNVYRQEHDAILAILRAREAEGGWVEAEREACERIVRDEMAEGPLSTRLGKVADAIAARKGKP
jgi:hypothetical protein